MTNNVLTAGQTMHQLYLDRNETGDITFCVDSQRIPAHRMVLAAKSPKYRAQFYGLLRDSHEISIPNVSAAAFNVFLQLFYRPTVDLTMENIRVVLDLAKQTLVDEFVESCANFLTDQLTATNLFELYEMAIFYDIKSLRWFCEQQISVNTMHIFASDDFLRCDRDVLCGILAIDALNCNEINVFAACIAWARVHCQRNRLEYWKPEILRAALGDAIDQIRFSSFNVAEFMETYKSLDGFFTVDEFSEIIQIIENMNDAAPQKLNRTLKKRSKPLLGIPGSLLKCNRYACRRRRNGSARSRLIVEGATFFDFHFSCSNPIRLHGITFDFRFGDDDIDNLPTTISIAARHDDHGPLVSYESKYKIYRYAIEKDEIVVMFDAPIEQIIYFSCSLRLPSPCPIYGPELKSRADVRGTKFVLFGDSVSRLYFDLVPKTDGLFHDFGQFLKSSKKSKIPIYTWSPFPSNL